MVLVFFSLSRGKLAPYILPALLPLALLLGRRLADFSDSLRAWTIDRGLRLSLWVWTMAGLVLVGLLLWPPLFLLRALSRANLEPSYVLLVAAVFTLTPLLTLAGRHLSLLFLGVGALVLSSLLPVGLERLSLQRSPRELGRLVRSRWQPGDALVGAYLYSQGLSFYSGQVFHLMESRTELDFGRKLAPGAGAGALLCQRRGNGEVCPLPAPGLPLSEGDRPGEPEAGVAGKIQILARQGDCLLLAYERE